MEFKNKHILTLRNFSYLIKNKSDLFKSQFYDVEYILRILLQFSADLKESEHCFNYDL